MSDTILQDAPAVKILYVPLGHTAPLPTLWRPDAAPTAPTAAPLRAFWVSDLDVFAAFSAEDALALALKPGGDFDALELDDVAEVTAADLDKPMVEEDGAPCGTLRELLATTTEPGWLVGFE